MSDLINKQDVLKLIENAPYDWSNITERTEMLREIKALPSADRPTGEWKDSYDASRICGVELKVCSVCNKEYIRNLAKRFNFCPNCGARMKGTDDE
jgi:hypothetical protein